MQPIEKVGFIGLGVMGEPMCLNLAEKCGRPVIAYDLNPKAMARVRSEGIATAASIAELCNEADLIITSLPDGEALAAVGEELIDHLEAGQVVVDTSTAPVRLTRQLAMRLELRNVDYADAPIARTRTAARNGTLSIMVGAAPEVFQRIRPFLDCMGEEITHCGDVGTGQVMKQMNNMVLVQTVQALAEAITIARRAGVEPDLLLNTLSKGSADSFALRNHGMKSMAPAVFPKKAFPTSYMLKDLSYALELAAEYEVRTPGADAAADSLNATIDAGLTEAYFPALLAILDPELDYSTPDGD